MLAAEPHDIGPPLRGVEEQSEREAGPRADRVPGFELGYVLLAPGAEAGALDRCQLDAAGRVVVAPALENALRHQDAKGAEEIARGGWRFRLGRDHAVDVHALQQRDPLVAVLGAEALEDVAAGAAALRRERGEGGGCKVIDDSGADGAGHGASGADWSASSLAGERGLVGINKFCSSRSPRKRNALTAGEADVAAQLVVPVDEFVDVGEADLCHLLFRTSSHSFAQLVWIGFSLLEVSCTLILPSRSTVTPVTSQPASFAALMAAATSRWRKVNLPRGIFI